MAVLSSNALLAVLVIAVGFGSETAVVVWFIFFSSPQLHSPLEGALTLFFFLLAYFRTGATSYEVCSCGLASFVSTTMVGMIFIPCRWLFCPVGMGRFQYFIYFNVKDSFSVVFFNSHSSDWL